MKRIIGLLLVILLVVGCEGVTIPGTSAGNSDKVTIEKGFSMEQQAKGVEALEALLAVTKED